MSTRLTLREITEGVAECEKIASDAWAAASVAAKAEVALLPKYETKPCPRCRGNGWDHFIGQDRPMGVCFRCAGSGEVIKSNADVAARKKALAGIEVVCLRARYVGARAALRRAQELGLPDFEIRKFQSRLDWLVAAGKTAAAQAA